MCGCKQLSPLIHLNGMAGFNHTIWIINGCMDDTDQMGSVPSHVA